MYVPPDQSKYYNDDEFFNFELDIMSKCSQYPNILITGDANAQTSNLADYVEFDDFIGNYFDLDENTLRSFSKISHLSELNIPQNRISKCKKVNKIGKKMLEICKNNDLIILNGRIGNDSTGNYTFRDTSVIDYTISSINALSLVENFEISELDRLFSDGHCLLETEMKLQISFNTMVGKASQQNSHKWKENKKTDFINNLKESATNDINEALRNFNQSDPKCGINEIA